MHKQLLRQSIMAALAAMAAHGGVAHAQARDNAEELETITVVGSRIKRTDIETSQPVFVIEREDLQRTGLATIGDILQDLTTNGAALNTTFNNGGDGTTAVDLRDLGTGRTLVLVNGRRWVTNLDGFVDLNTIPVSIIERVEVLKDGASAIYGSDAISGVVNITTRDTYDGAEASAYLGENEEGDGRTEQYDFTIGSSTDRASVVLNASYTKVEPVSAADRAISAVPLFGFGGNNVNVGASSTTPFGRFGFGNSGGQLPNGGPGTLTLIPGRTGTSADDFKPFAATTDGYNFAPNNYLLTPQERQSVYASARYQINDAIAFRTNIVYNERRSEQQLAAVPFTLGAAPGATTLQRAIVISANNVYNPFGADVTRAQFRNQTQFRNFNQDSDTFYFSAGLDGGFDFLDRTWSWDVNYTYTDNEQNDVTFGQFDNNRLRDGLGASFIDAQGVARCGTPTAVIAGCVPINLFGGPDGFTQAMVDFAGVTLQDTFYKKLYNYTANITGDLFELPAGPLGIAAGYEYRREFGFDQPDAITASGATTGNGRLPTRGGFSLDEFYTELNIPVLADLPLAQTLEFSVAARYSDYSNFGDTTNLKFGFRWKPVDDVLFRGNWAEGFRAPTVADLFSGQADAFPQINDPCSAGLNPSGEVLSRCRNGIGGVTGVPVGYQQGNSQIRVTVGGNPDLGPEEATNRTLGIVYSPSWFEGLDLYLDWYNIEVTNAITGIDAQELFDDCYERGNLSSCALITRAANGDVIGAFAGTVNGVGGLEIEGYDFTVTYRFDTEFGRFSVNWDNAYVSYYGDVNQPEAGDLLPNGDTSLGNVVGVYTDRLNFSNRLKSNISTNWHLGDVGATLTARYISPLDEDCTLPAAFGRPELCSNVEGSPQFGSENRIDDVWYFDVQATWDAPWNARVTGGIRNVGDEDPPYSASTFANSFDPQYDVPGRFWYVQYTQKF
jgi:iron complex outermembrane receptor protein